jgi:hypothetical protein
MEQSNVKGAAACKLHLDEIRAAEVNVHCCA